MASASTTTTAFTWRPTPRVCGYTVGAHRTKQKSITSSASGCINGLSVVTWALTDAPPGQGGFACVPGSHKANYPCPEDILYFERDPGCVAQVPMRAGDVVIFTEALTHGTHPWTAAHQRRSLLYKYAPKHLAWGRYDRHRNDDVYDLLTERQRRLLEPPYIPDRQPIVGTEGPDGVYD